MFRCVFGPVDWLHAASRIRFFAHSLKWYLEHHYRIGTFTEADFKFQTLCSNNSDVRGFLQYDTLVTKIYLNIIQKFNPLLTENTLPPLEKNNRLMF